MTDGRSIITQARAKRLATPTVETKTGALASGNYESIIMAAGIIRLGASTSHGVPVCPARFPRRSLPYWRLSRPPVRPVGWPGPRQQEPRFRWALIQRRAPPRRHCHYLSLSYWLRRLRPQLRPAYVVTGGPAWASRPRRRHRPHWSWCRPPCVVADGAWALPRRLVRLKLP